MSRSLLLALCAILLSPTANTQPLPDDPAVAECQARASPYASARQRWTFNVTDNSGMVGTTVARLWWKRFDDALSRALIRVETPGHRAGVGLLALEAKDGRPELYLYLPELRRTRRITGNALAGSLLGTDFSYEDFAHFQHLSTAGVSHRLDDETIDGVTYQVIETVPAPDSSPYGRIVTYFDAARCLPLRARFLAPNDEIHKELVVDRETIATIDGVAVPGRIEMTDFRQDSRTELLIDEVELNPRLRDSIFSPSSLKFGG